MYENKREIYMNNSSAQESYSITSSDTITLTTSSNYSNCHTITLNTSCITTPSITFTNNASAQYASYGSGSTVGGIINWNISQEEFVDCLPDINRVKNMCEEYPGLKIAYEKFVTTYKLVKDHYDTPEDQRPKP